MHKIWTIIGLILLIYSCKKDNGVLIIDNFNKTDTITVIPYKFRPYALLNLRIKGLVNDTIKVKTEGVFNLELILSGALDTVVVSDYYGEGPIKCIFDPYKASEGYLIIEIDL